MNKKETKIQELERRIKDLELKQPHIFYLQSPTILPPNPNLHYHGTTPCYNNPCVWC